MLKAATKVFIVLVMFVAFIGQTMTYNASLSCETSVDTHSSSNVGELEHQHDSISADKTISTDCCGIECCDADCICISNACSAIAYFNVDISSTKVPLLSETVFKQKAEQPQSIATLHYRPPIFISINT